MGKVFFFPGCPISPPHFLWCKMLQVKFWRGSWLQVRFGLPFVLASSLCISSSLHTSCQQTVQQRAWSWTDGTERWRKGRGSLFACGRWTWRWCALCLQSAPESTAALDRLTALQLSDSVRISRVKYKGETSALPERPAANQKWRVEKSWNVESNKRRRCFISLDRGRRNERAGGTQQIKFKAAEMRVHAMWDTPEAPHPLSSTTMHIALPWNVLLISLAPERWRNLLRGKLEPYWSGLGSM